MKGHLAWTTGVDFSPVSAARGALFLPYPGAAALRHLGSQAYYTAFLSGFLSLSVRRLPLSCAQGMAGT